MTGMFDKLLGNKPIILETKNIHLDNKRESVEQKRITGKIIKLSDKGWGFISSKEIPFTRIFFHWTGLNQNTLKFNELKTGMIVEFISIELKEDSKEKGWRAIKIEVVK